MCDKRDFKSNKVTFGTINYSDLANMIGIEDGFQEIEVSPKRCCVPRKFSDSIEKGYNVFPKSGDEGENSNSKLGMFLWACLKLCSQRQEPEERKLTSTNNFFKDEVSNILQETFLEFEDRDFDATISRLENLNLIRTTCDSVRLTQHFADLFHQKMGAWLEF